MTDRPEMGGHRAPAQKHHQEQPAKDICGAIQIGLGQGDAGDGRHDRDALERIGRR